MHRVFDLHLADRANWFLVDIFEPQAASELSEETMPDPSEKTYTFCDILIEKLLWQKVRLNGINLKLLRSILQHNQANIIPQPLN